MHSKSAIKVLMILALGLSLLIFSGCATRGISDRLGELGELADGLAEAIEESELLDRLDELGDLVEGLAETITEEVYAAIEESFLMYGEFGLTFDSETTSLYYNDEPVAFFEDRRGLVRTTFGNRNASGLHIRAQRDGSGDLIGLEVTRR